MLQVVSWALLVIYNNTLLMILFCMIEISFVAIRPVGGGQAKYYWCSTAAHFYAFQYNSETDYSLLAS